MSYRRLSGYRPSDPPSDDSQARWNRQFDNFAGCQIIVDVVLVIAMIWLWATAK